MDIQYLEAKLMALEAKVMMLEVNFEAMKSDMKEMATDIKEVSVDVRTLRDTWLRIEGGFSALKWWVGLGTGSVAALQIIDLLTKLNMH
jgi:hypothetical protein